MIKPDAVLIDCDGTLADVRSIRHYVAQRPKAFDKFHAESVNVPVHQQAVDIAREAHAAGQVVIIVTARRHRWRHVTAWFLAMHNIPSDVLIMRADDDHRPDVEVKRDILAQIRTRWNPVLAVDDNPKVAAMWSEEGIPVIMIPGWEE